MNTDALCAHSANFRADIVDEVFGRLGIGGVTRRLHLVSPLTEHLASIYPELQVEALKAEQKYFHLNDLAERRNEVAHGNASEILSPALIITYVDFVAAFGAALYELVRSHYFELVALHGAKPIGKAIAVYNNEIVCIELNNVEVMVGDMIIPKTGSGVRPCLAGGILELQIDKQAIEVCPPGEAVKVGMRVAFRCKEGYQYFLARHVPEA
jgi:hypothetical protein